MTGETGAGKSLIINAIGLLFGDRCTSLLIKTGKIKACVEGTFVNVSNKTKTILARLQIELLDDDIIVIKREISNTGKNLIKINGEIVTLSQLEKIAETLGNIHTQLDTNRLFTQTNYLKFIDGQNINCILEEYSFIRNEYLNKLIEYNELVKLNETKTNELEYLEYQLNELEKANLNIDEEESLLEELNYLNNYNLIYNNLISINDCFESNNIIENINSILNLLDKVSSFKEDYKEYFNKLIDSYYEYEELKNKVKHDLDNLDFSPDRLDYINHRLNEIKRLKNRYKKTMSELIAFRGEIKAKIETFELLEDNLLGCKKSVEILHTKLQAISRKLTEIRKENAKKLENDIINTLKDLMLDKVEFSIEFNEYEFSDAFNSSVFKSDGCDKIDFYISFNKGESKKSISKVASGGEMSRVMMALKCNLINNLELSTIIFDEIDTGVSGEVAEAMAKKMKEISNCVQVIAITHLPIVASFADHHYLIYKNIVDDQTKSYIKELSYDEKIECLSRMINPGDSTKQTKELVKNMLINK